MARSRLKTIIILILAVANLFLLAALGWRTAEERSARERTVQELTERFAAMDVALEAELPEEAVPPAQSLIRSTDREDAMAAALLGEDARAEDLGGGIRRYTSPLGQATFRAGGSFDVTGQLGEGTEAFCRSLCKEFGYGEFSAGEDGSYTAVQYFGELPVVNASLTFRTEGGRLTGLQGTLLPQLTGTQEEADRSVTAVTALTLFLEDCRATGTVVSRVTAVEPAYQLQSTASAPMSLSPVWRITADTGQFTVSCATGKVSHG